jgi:hypothetical protein
MWHGYPVARNRAEHVGTTVQLTGAQDPLVLVLDLGSTSSRAAVYDATATVVAGLHAVAGAAAEGSASPPAAHGAALPDG